MDAINTLAILDHNEIEKVRSLDQNPAAAYLAKLRPTGRRSQKQALEKIAFILSNGASDWQAIPWHTVRYQHAQAIRSVLVEQYEPATVNRILAALRGAAKQAWLLGQMDAGDYLKLAEVDPVISEGVLAGRFINDPEIKALMQSCEKDPGICGVRDAAIIGMMAAGGLRREEIVKLDLNDFDQATGKLKVHGKRGKTREIFLDNGALAAVLDWLKARGATDGALFIHVNKSGKFTFRRLTNQAIYFMLAKRGRLAGVKLLSPHDLRRTCATNMLGHGIDAITVARFLGHSSVNTTMKYDRRPETEKKKAAQSMFIPYTPRTIA
jgi:integrase/recombinase XerD